MTCILQERQICVACVHACDREHSKGPYKEPGEHSGAHVTRHVMRDLLTVSISLVACWPEGSVAMPEEHAQPQLSVGPVQACVVRLSLKHHHVDALADD